MRSAVGRIVAPSVVSSLLAPSALGAASLDRLDRFRELPKGLDPGAESALGEVYSVLDSEVVESLGAGGVFASPEFLQDRLEAFTEA